MPSRSQKQRYSSDRPMPSAQSAFEKCERRLVLSAQLLFDALGDHALEMHDLSAGTLEMHGEQDLDSHLQQAHAATGLNQVRDAFGLTGAGQTVAVIDSGIAWDHEALGEGFGPGYRVVGGWDFTEENDASPYDDGPAGFHGTHVAGIIGSDDSTHPGVAPGADLVALRVFNDWGQGQMAWVEQALDWVHQHRNSFENPITTVNLSLGSQWNSETVPAWGILEDELQQLAADGIVVTASAGNSFADYNSVGLSYPAASEYVLPVASLDDDGTLSDFSQRSQRVLAAPGSQIMSTIPDHVFGRDGDVNDFSPASGTSMASPYVAGASVLVRQAMEMTGWESINVGTIAGHLRSTADSVYDAVTGLHYDTLNLENAIESLLPTDLAANGSGSLTTVDIDAPVFDNWINRLGDVDAYRFTANTHGSWSFNLGSDWVDGLQWTVHSQGQLIAQGGTGDAQLDLVAGQSYEFALSANQQIGSFHLHSEFEASAPPAAPPVELGSIQYSESQQAGGNSYAFTASRNGTLSLEWQEASNNEAVQLRDANGNVVAQSRYIDGLQRLDLEVTAGERFSAYLPGGANGQLTLANLLSRQGTTLSVSGTLGSDAYELNLQNGINLSIGSLDYQFDSLEINQLNIDGGGSNDTLDVVGTSRLDKVELRPGNSSIETANVDVSIVGLEGITYDSGGGADRVYLYDSDTDDTLRARPGEAELEGVGYRFEVSSVQRIFMHATGGGQDYAYLYDSEGDDRLSVRPQFTSISGDGFFNYVRGFERVYAYANAGGTDEAVLYDSAGDDRFTTSGVSASVVGPGFSSFTRGFEHVNASSDAGGNDRATLYGANHTTKWQTGSDFISFQEGSWQREARGFESVETYVDRQSFQLANWSPTPAEGVLGTQSVSAATPAAAAKVVPWATEALLASPDLVSPQQFDSPTYNSQLEPNWTTHAPIAEQNVAFNAMAPTFDALTEMLQRPLASDTVNSETFEPRTGDPSPATRAIMDTEDAPIQVLADVSSSEAPRSENAAELAIWLEAFEMQELLADKLHLPEEQLMDDSELEAKLLDEAFRQFERQF